MIPFNLTAINHLGNSMVLSGMTPEFLVEYSGFDAPQMNIMTTQLYNKDGALYQGAKAQPRDILLNVYIFNHVTRWRTDFYRTFIVGQLITLRYEKDGTIRTIQGVVDKITVPQFDEPSKGKQIMQISVVCNNPWWASPTRIITKSITRSSIGSDSVAFDISYDGDIATGLLIDFDFTSVTQFQNPSVTLLDGNGKASELSINSISLGLLHEHVYIDSVDKKLYAVSSGTENNLINMWKRNNQWMKLTRGNNTVTINSTLISAGTFKATISYKELYQGV